MRVTATAPLFLAAALAACSSQIPTIAEWAGSLVGRNVSLLRDMAKPRESYSARIGWQEKTYALPNGNWVYVQPDRPNCEIHFEVNGEDTIVGYTPVGTGCVHQ
jgi:hypothetical protein